MNLCEVGERLELVKKELRDVLRELAQETPPPDLGKDRARLEAALREINEIIRPMPPIHVWC